MTWWLVATNAARVDSFVAKITPDPIPYSEAIRTIAGEILATRFGKDSGVGDGMGVGTEVGVGVGVGVGAGIGVGAGVGVGLGEGEGEGVGLGVGEGIDVAV